MGFPDPLTASSCRHTHDSKIAQLGYILDWLMAVCISTVQVGAFLFAGEFSRTAFGLVLRNL